MEQITCGIHGVEGNCFTLKSIDFTILPTIVARTNLKTYHGFWVRFQLVVCFQTSRFSGTETKRRDIARITIRLRQFVLDLICFSFMTQDEEGEDNKNYSRI